MKIFGFRIQGNRHVSARHGRKKHRACLLAAVLLIIIFVGLLLWHQNRTGTGLFTEKDAHLSYIEGIPVHEDFLPEDAAGRPGGKRKIMYIVIHETDNVAAGADAAAHNSFIHNNGQIHELSWHYTVDDHQIYHHLPDNEPAYHAGDQMTPNGGNMNGIGVEMCVNSDGNYEQTIQNTQNLAAVLLCEYGLKLDDLKKHQDFSGKNCPSMILDRNQWEEFVDGVEQALDKLKK